MEQKPSVGRIVHVYLDNGILYPHGDPCVAAIITFVHENGLVDLTVFPAGHSNSFPVVNVDISKWHFPERV